MIDVITYGIVDVLNNDRCYGIVDILNNDRCYGIVDILNNDRCYGIVDILNNDRSGLDIGYVPAGPHAFFRSSGQFGPQQFILCWPAGPVAFRSMANACTSFFC